MLRSNPGESVERALQETRRLILQSLDLERRMEEAGSAVYDQLCPAPSRLDEGPERGRDRCVSAAEARSTSFLLARLSDVRRICLTARDLRHVWERLLLNAAADAATGPARGGLKPRVLVVDDSSDTCELVATILTMAEFDVITAPNGLEGLIAAYESRPSLILMDLHMPVLDGLEATRLLKAGPATRHVPVIAHTARPTACGTPHLFADVLPKPVVSEALIARVRQFALPS